MLQVQRLKKLSNVNCISSSINQVPELFFAFLLLNIQIARIEIMSTKFA